MDSFRHGRHWFVFICLSIVSSFFFSTSSLAGTIIDMPNVEDASPILDESIFENYNIPSLRFRDANPETSPRLWIKQIRIQGTNDFPELGIFREDVLKYAESLRVDAMRENELLEHGYTQQEIAEILDLLNELEVSKQYEHVSTPDLQRFIWLVRQQKSRRGLSFSQLDDIAFKIKAYYRDRGLGLTEAFIPRQAFRDGILNIVVLGGVLGNVKIKSESPATLYKPKDLSRVFDNLLTLPVKFDLIEERLYWLNDFPGLRVSADFEAGQQVGDSTLLLNLLKQQRFDGLLRLDNHGAEATGEHLLYGLLNVNNAMGLTDLFSVGFLQGFSPDNSTYGHVDFSLPLFSPRWSTKLSVSNNQFIFDNTDASSSVNDLGLSGKTLQKEWSLSYAFQRGRSSNWWFDLLYYSTDARLDSSRFAGFDILNNKVRNVVLQSRFDVLDTHRRLLHLGSLRFTQGEFVFGQSANQNKTYSHFNLDYTRLSFLPLPWFNAESRLILKGALQFSEDNLPSTEQFALGGPTVVSAFPVNQFSSDWGVFVSAQWVFNSPGWFLKHGFSKFQPSLFINAAHGVQLALEEEANIKGSLADAGLGLQFATSNKLSGNLQWAFPVVDDFSDSSISVPDDDWKLVFDMQLRFH